VVSAEARAGAEGRAQEPRAIQDTDYLPRFSLPDVDGVLVAVGGQVLAVRAEDHTAVIDQSVLLPREGEHHLPGRGLADTHLARALHEGDAGGVGAQELLVLLDLTRREVRAGRAGAARTDAQVGPDNF